MGNPNQPMDGPNGSYSVCGHCGEKYGSPPEGGIGMWIGTCDICGCPDMYLSNALHDWNMSNAKCLEAIAIEQGSK